MKPFTPPPKSQSRPLIGLSYFASRHGGASPEFARLELALPAATGAALEQLFQRRPTGGTDPMRPRFARHSAHVDAVMAQGGYPVLRERRR